MASKADQAKQVPPGDSKATKQAKKKDAKRRHKEAKRESMIVAAGTADAAAAVEASDIVEDIELESNVTRETLEGTPLRCLTFLKAIGTSAPIRAAMATRGYRQEDHQEGWNLLHTVSGYQSAPAATEDTSVHDAIQAIDAWDEDGFRIISATLKHRFPEQARFVLEGLTASTGALAVLGVNRLLDRLDELEHGNDRRDSKARDHAALELLAQRGIDAHQRKHLRTLIATAESAPDTAAPSPAELADADAAYLKGLVALRNWFEEWTTMARVAIRRRDYLIRLGLARRQVHAAPAPANSAGSLAQSA